jgi:RNA polymerase sigma-70 factor (ECF subfamily)
VANEVRGRSRRRRLLRRLGDHELTSGTTPDAEPAGAWVRDALSTLSPSDQEVLRLVAWEGLTVDEVAVAVACSPPRGWSTR